MLGQARFRDRRYFCADQTAAAALGVSRRTIIRWRCQLEAEGKISRDGYHQWRPRCKTVVYRLNVTQRIPCKPRTSSSATRNTHSVRVSLRYGWHAKGSVTMRERDLAWETLVRETAANPAIERGALNTALKAIREAALTEGLTEEGIPEEIRLRANAYRDTFPGLTLTPIALAKHWFRVMVKPDTRTLEQRTLEGLFRDP